MCLQLVRWSGKRWMDGFLLSRRGYSLFLSSLPSFQGKSWSLKRTRLGEADTIHEVKKRYHVDKAQCPLSSSPVRIPGFHPGDPGSNPGNGIIFFFFFVSVSCVPNIFFSLLLCDTFTRRCCKNGSERSFHFVTLWKQNRKCFSRTVRVLAVRHGIDDLKLGKQITCSSQLDWTTSSSNHRPRVSSKSMDGWFFSCFHKDSSTGVIKINHYRAYYFYGPTSFVEASKSLLLV
jgi:hypothetical protein